MSSPSEHTPVRFALRYLVSNNLRLIHPRFIWALVAQARGNARALRRAGAHAPSPASYRQQVDYRLPFRGEWLVMNGGVSEATSHSWGLIGQRYAYDFVIADADGRRHQTDGTRLDDYLCYGQPILAPAGGEVVAVLDGVRDAPRPGTGWVDWRTPEIGGNAVTIHHAEGEYSYLAHLAAGSIRVGPGQRVRRGEPIARCGNSGNSTEPHLHFQVQDDSNFAQAIGLPVRFWIDDGAGGSTAVYPERGMRVSPPPTAP